MAVSVIASSGGDYTSLSAWEAAVQGTLSEIQEAECEAFADTTACTIDGSTTTSSFYHRIYAAAGAEAQMPWSTSAYRLSVTGAQSLTIDDNFVRVERIQVETTDNGSNRSFVRVGSGTNCRIVGVLARATGSLTGHSCFRLDTAGTLINCVAICNGGGNGVNITHGGATNSVVYSCTAVNASVGFNHNATTGTLTKNCLAYGNTTDFSGSFHANSTNNASEDGTAPNTNEVTITADPFVDYANRDLHIATGSDVEDAGADLSGDATFPFSTDFDGATRTGTWDIGADELTSSDIALTVADALIGLGAESPALVQANVLAVADALIALAAESPALTQANTLVVADALIALAAESPSLTQANVLAVADALIVLAAESPTLETGTLLAVADALISLSAESPTLTQQNVLAVADALIALAAESPALTQANTLVANDSTVALSFETPTLSLATEDEVVTGKYEPEHDAALVDLAAATGFSSEHASARSDLAAAGV